MTAAARALALSLAALLALSLAAGRASAQPADTLRTANDAATAGDWPRVAALVEPLLAVGAVPPADRAEAYRLAGMAAFFHQRRDVAEAHFLAYLKIELDGRLDPALYPPEVVGFFDEVRTKHQAELRARRTRARRYWVLNLIPPGGQIQNGERRKAWIVGGLLGAFAAANITTYAVLSSWCTRVSGDGGSSVTCDEGNGSDRASTASALRTLNLLSGIGLLAVYAYGVYDGASGYKARAARSGAAAIEDRGVRSTWPFVGGVSGGGVLGVSGSF